MLISDENLRREDRNKRTILLRIRLAYMNRRGHHQIYRDATLHRAMQTAIADEFRARYEPPRELTRELSGVMTKLDDPKELCLWERGLNQTSITGVERPNSAPTCTGNVGAHGYANQRHRFVPVCPECGAAMRLIRRGPHSTLGRGYEQQIFACAKCLHEVERSADKDGKPHTA